MGIYGGNARSDSNYIVRGGAIAVPANFVGMHFRAWPIFNSAFWAASGQPYPTAPSAAPTNMAFGEFRTHGCGYLYWYQIETSAGVYDWSNLDLLISTHRNAGRTVVFTLYGTPSFYLLGSNPALGTLNQNSVYPDSTSPNGLTGASNFITALITRYNTASGGWATQVNGAGTNWSVIGKGIQALELWNEPDYSGSTTIFSFWSNSAGLLVDLCKTVRAAALAVDGALKVVSPGFIATNTMQSFLQAVGVTNNTTTGLSLCDAICIHFYRVMPPCLGLGVFNHEIIAADQNLKTVIATCGGSALPVWCTECGIDFNFPTAETTLITAQTPAWRYNWWGRVMLVAAALGYKKWMAYAWDVPYMSHPDTDPNGTAKAINDVHVNVAGKTIKNAFYDVGGAVTLQFSDNSSFAI